MKSGDIGHLAQICQQILVGPMHEFCFSHSKSPVGNICKVHLLPRANDNGTQFLHLSRVRGGLEVL